ncbi:GNAT family N-acetyltransferase [Roseateles sp. MS654]|uniref:GNAT family N-acetyltransferase n=1 Tax=Roseateles sp. MS654 TaxID=3412685 RepID=UPI003C30E5E2
MHAAALSPMAADALRALPARAPRALASTDAAPSTPLQRVQMEVVKLTSRDLQWLPALTTLLIDNVHQGATLGFLAPLSRYQALDYWHGVFARLGQHHMLWIACESEGPGRLLGAVQLSLCPLANAHHRGEVQRLMVHSQERNRGVASQLMSRLECAAATQGRFLLRLETCADSQAEAVFAHLGWQRAGQIPDDSHGAEGQLQAAALYWKRLPHLV